MTRHTIICRLAVLGALAAGCGGDNAEVPPPPTTSGFDSGDDGGDAPDDGATETPGSDSVDDTGPVDPTNAGEDGGEPPGPTEELCDAGDEAWVKRAIPFIQGRRPEGMREVRLLASAVQQLDAMDLPGRELVAKALASGDLYTERWKTYFFEKLRVNRSGDRRNYFCYGRVTDLAADPDLAAAIRDSDPRDPPAFTDFTMADVVYSAIALDDISPAFRADTFARMAAPVTAGNVSAEELEITNRTTYGKMFEGVHLGRTTECLQCHTTQSSVTWTPDLDANRHWPVRPDAFFEHAAYGEFDMSQPLEDPDVHALFRHAGFVDYSWCAGGCTLAARDAAPGIEPWGLEGNCGIFRTDHVAGAGVDLPYESYMAGEFPDGNLATVFDLDPRVRDGLDTLASEGVRGDGAGSIDNPNVSLAFLFAMNTADEMWREAQGYPLTVANRFPRNDKQREILQTLTEAFYASHYSPRELIAAVVTHPYYNQAPPSECGASGPYHLAAVYDPFTKSAVDPQERGNGVGDMLHRYSAFVLLDSTAQALWWDRAERFGPATEGAFLPVHMPPGAFDAPAYIAHINPDTGANLQCCGAGYCGGEICDDAPPNVDFQRDSGTFINDSESGFNGVDFNGLLHWEEEVAAGEDPQLGGACTGPLGGACAGSDWVDQLVAEAIDTPEAMMWDLAVAIKDRLVTEPSIYSDAEIAAIEGVMGESLDDTVASVGASAAEVAARRYVGLMLNTPQYMLDGVTSRDQDPVADAILVVPGTDAESACEYFASLANGSADWSGVSVSCGGDSITVE
jgi:hypothetical protein